MTTRIVTDSNGRKHITTEPLLHPPQRTWVGLTEEEIKECFKITPDLFLPWHIYAKIEAKLKEKNA